MSTFQRVYCLATSLKFSSKSCFTFFALLFTNLCHAQTQIITTIAGNGTTGYTGDGGPATDAQLWGPAGIKIDVASNLYIAEITNNRIRKVNSSGIITTVAGGGTSSADGIPATDASLNDPQNLTVDGAGNLYIAVIGSGDNRVRMVNTSGIITTVAGTGTYGFTGDGGPATLASFEHPEDITVDLAGNIYIADNANSRIRKVDASGIITTIAGSISTGYGGDGGPATIAQLNYPGGVAVDGVGNVYIADQVNQRIRKVNSSGIITTIAGIGTIGYSGDGYAATLAKLHNPHNIYVDGSGNIFFGDAGNFVIRKINTAGIITTIAGTGVSGYTGDGCAATSSELDFPWGIDIDGTGNIYFADELNERVRKLSNDSPPLFTGGHSQHLVFCGDETSISIDTLAAISDLDIGQMEIWSIVTPPAHGTLIASDTSTSTGGIVIPSGLLYTPSGGYTGTDTFGIQIADCGNLMDTTTVYVTISPLPHAGSITGIDSVCIGRNVTLSDTATGGVWSSSNISISTTSASGLVTGIAPGMDTICYTVTTPGCNPATAMVSFKVLEECPEYVKILAPKAPSVSIYPNPNEGTFNISLSSIAGEEATIVITDIIGQKIKELTIPVINGADEAKVQLNAPPGIYFLSATTKNERMNVKIVVE